MKNIVNKQAKKKKELSPERMEKFKKIYKEVRFDSRFGKNDEFIQHGTTTVKMHCVNVAYTAYYIVEKLGLDVDEDELIRGALLHDYFLYDWHEKSLENSIHGFTHPGKSLKNARADFDLTATERDMIKHHMFPLTPLPPKSKEGKILCLADKLIATRETLEGKGLINRKSNIAANNMEDNE